MTVNRHNLKGEVRMRKTVIACVWILSLVASSLAESAWFAEGRGGVTWLQGTSSSENSGASFGGGGDVSQIDFDAGSSIGGMIGRSFSDGNWAVGLSFDHLVSDTSFEASFPFENQVSIFEGQAESDVVMVNLLRRFRLSTGSHPVSLLIGAGVGAAFNSLVDITEDFRGGDGVADEIIAEDSNTDFAARGTCAIDYAVNNWMSIQISGNAFYLGTFQTGNSRTGPVSLASMTQDIEPYVLDDIWGIGVLAGITVHF